MTVTLSKSSSLRRRRQPSGEGEENQPVKKGNFTVEVEERVYHTKAKQDNNAQEAQAVGKGAWEGVGNRAEEVVAKTEEATTSETNATACHDNNTESRDCIEIRTGTNADDVDIAGDAKQITSEEDIPKALTDEVINTSNTKLDRFEDDYNDTLDCIEIRSAAQWKAVSGRITFKDVEEEEDDVKPNVRDVNDSDGFVPTKVQQLRLICWKVNYFINAIKRG